MRRLLASVSLLSACGAGPAAAQPAPPLADAGSYDARVRQSFAAAEAFQGPLDGGWTLSAGETPLFAIQVSERDGRLEAAWRDLRRPGAVAASGFVDALDRAAGKLTLRFASAPGVQDIATLSAQRGGTWSGDLEENGRRLAVTLARAAP